MNTQEFLIDMCQRTQRNFKGLIEHCSKLSNVQLHQKLDGFGYPTIQLQIHHVIAAERYWLGVLKGQMILDEDEKEYPSANSLEAMRQKVAAETIAYIESHTDDELDRPRKVVTWQKKEPLLAPVHVITRTQVHVYHHQGQVLAMCRLLGRPTSGLDYPILSE